MSEKEKKIIEAVAKALPNMSERDKGYFLGYAEAKASAKGEKDDFGSSRAESRIEEEIEKGKVVRRGQSR